MMNVSLRDLWGRRLSVDVEKKFSDISAEINAVRAEEKKEEKKDSKDGQ